MSVFQIPSFNLPDLNHYKLGDVIQLINGERYVFTSTGWDPLSPQILAQNAIPVILAPNGTVATNGAITLGTALPAIYPDAWVYLPAGAVVGGAAGLYYTKFTSTTAGQVYTNYASGSTAFIPYDADALGATAAVGSNAAYTQTTAADVVLANVTVKGGSMGTNGAVRITGEYSSNNSLGNKTVKAILGTTAIAFLNTAASWTVGRINGFVRNRNGLKSNFSMQNGSAGGTGFGTATANYTTEDTSADIALTLTGQIATATDYVVLEGFTVELLPA